MCLSKANVSRISSDEQPADLTLEQLHNILQLI